MLITKREDVRKQGFCTIPGSSGGSLTDLLLESFWEGVGWGGVGWGGHLFKAGRLLTFSAFRMGAYSRWVLI